LLFARQPVGIVTCFVGFSTFAARPLINIHDLYVTGDCRRTGVARSLLETVEQKARELGCCKLTLEVQENNQPALALYGRFGFVSGHEAGPAQSLDEEALLPPYLGSTDTAATRVWTR
jgi:ribosomal protein S18 acetylase RimI-like enzyme